MKIARYTIGAKIFGAFAVMSAIIGLMGLASYGVLSAAGNIAVTTFDGPLMAINYARAAQNDFTEMQLAEQRFEHAHPSDRPAIAAQIDELYAIFNEDLDVAAQRSLEADEQKIIAEIRPLMQRWSQARAKGDMAGLARLDTQIDEKFDLLIEFNTGHSFIGRRQTVTNIANYKYALIAMTALALLLAAGITLLLRSRIVRPLQAAASVADRIAKGELQTPIPQGGGDETGALLGSMTVMQDNIRDMMGRETALRRSAENRLADALETSREGMILVAPDGRIAMANGTLREFFPAIAQNLVPGMAFDAALGLIQQQLAPTQAPSEDISTSGHAELELADGRWLRMTGSSTSEGGSIIFLSEFTAIKEREESLRRAKREAEAANASKTRFLANMSHELRTPLNAIIGFSEITAGQLFGKLGNDRYLDYSYDILRSGRHLLSVINDVLDLSRSESGKLMMDAKPVDMRYVLKDCVAMVREQCAAAGHTLAAPVPDHEIALAGDAAKLRQIFLNLLSNAIKFTEPGGTISLEVAEAQDAIAVTVGDTGIGMDPEDVEVAFQPFAQVDNRLERRYEGTGLGLPLTKALVDLHKGGIRIDSARGRGTRITITFPRPASQALQQAV
jgi:signal transduction histidine kinase/HAMP domain-containing protein